MTAAVLWYSLGVVCLIAAILGGSSVKLLELEMPGVNSLPRQLLLGGLGLTIIAASYVGVLPGTEKKRVDKEAVAPQVAPPSGQLPATISAGPKPETTNSAITPPPPAPPEKGADRFVGNWKNENQDTGGITRVKIDTRLNQILVRIWGKCEPSDCDWGTRSIPSSAADEDALKVTWDHGFSVTRLQFKNLQYDRLEVSLQTHFTDNSGRPDIGDVYYFVKSK